MILKVVGKIFSLKFQCFNIIDNGSFKDTNECLEMNAKVFLSVGNIFLIDQNRKLQTNNHNQIIIYMPSFSDIFYVQIGFRKFKALYKYYEITLTIAMFLIKM